MSNLAPRRPGPSVSRGVYGFVIYLSARLFFVTYLIWAVVPQKILDEYGLDDFFPSKYWVLAFPAWIVVFVIFIFLIYFAINEKLAAEQNYFERLKPRVFEKTIFF
ncbi:unnamed protein product [Oikopleura dioica]|uniref:PIG-P domain-containing protein n=1 Tax=Oikopleura dioica TaxID=34765 RepID=E4Y655_OIKDI|nr:unnamed protein product [Oikopleura dioica]CBY40025.1 unnamed protein product [Oikopleura dioica]